MLSPRKVSEVSGLRYCIISGRMDFHSSKNRDFAFLVWKAVAQSFHDGQSDWVIMRSRKPDHMPSAAFIAGTIILQKEGVML